MNINNGITFKKVPPMNIMHILEAKCVSSLHVSAGSSVVSARGALTHRQKADRHQLVLVIQHLIWSRSSLSSWKILYAPRHRLSNIWKFSGINCFTHSCNTQSASIKDIKHDLEMYKSSDNWIVLLIKRVMIADMITVKVMKFKRDSQMIK